MKATREQVLAFRVARHHLHERLPAERVTEAADMGLQDTPPKQALLALAVRADATPADLDRLVIVQSIRGAPLAVAPADVPVFTVGLAPPDEEAAGVLIGTATQELEGIPAMEALDRVSEAVADALADGPLERDAFHQALRERLPQELLRWCKNCGSHHVHPSLWRATGVRGVLAIVGREGRTAIFGAPPPAPPVTDPGAELARRFLRTYGPARPPVFAAWAGLHAKHARALWDRAGELAEVQVEGKQAWLLAEDADALASPPAARGVRLVPGMDPYLSMRDRELLAPDPALRKRLWRPLGNPGAVLVDGVLAGLWRPAKKGKKLVVTVEPLNGRPREDALAEEAERLAPFRGAASGEIAWA
jgi:hypothetical protein